MSVNYPELGTVDQQTIIYAEGDRLTHPSGERLSDWSTASGD